MTADLVVSGIGAVLPPGDGGSEPWFDHRAELGQRGYKYVPVAAQYLLAAVKRGIADTSRELDDDSRHDCGVALGSNNCWSALHGAIDRTTLGSGIGPLRPALVPFFSVNLFLSKVTIEHQLNGFSLAMHSPRIAGMEAIEAGSRAIRLGRASWLIAGATETPLDSAEPGADGSDDGSVVLIFEPADQVLARDGRAYGRCRVRTMFVSPTAAGAGIQAAQPQVRRAVDELLPDGTGDVRLIADDSRASHVVAEALGPDVSVRQAGAGCLTPLRGVVDHLRSGTGPAIVATACRTGNVAIAAITPGDVTDGLDPVPATALATS